MSGDSLSPEVRARVLPILRETIDVIEPLDGARRSGARTQMGTYLRQLGLADQFDDYGAAEIQAAFAARPPEWHANLEALSRIEAETKGRLRAGDVVGAETTYASAYHLREELFGDLAEGAFADWLLEIGDLESAVKVVDASTGQGTKWQIEEKARILRQAGRRTEAVDFLVQQGAKATATGDLELLLMVAESLATARELGQARTVLRSAATSALAAVSGDVDRPLADDYRDDAPDHDTTPVAIAQFQCKIGDREGAVMTLKSVLQLKAPPVPYGGTTPGIETLNQRAAERWQKAGPELARALSRAGLERDVQSLLTAQPDQRAALLAGVITGNAERGAFDAAFETIQSRQNALAPDEREVSLRLDTDKVAGIAARLGNIAAFRRAISTLRERFPDDWQSVLYGLSCVDLAKAGKVDAALEFVRLIGPDERWEDLIYIVGGVTGISLYRPWAPQIRYFAP